jgi:hypothetical protein
MAATKIYSNGMKKPDGLSVLILFSQKEQTHE